MQNYIDELLDLWRLQVNGCSTKAPHILKVIWRPPPPDWLKVNTDGVTFGDRSLASCAGVFRTCRCFVKSCFAIPLGVCFAFEAEWAAVVHAIEYA